MGDVAIICLCVSWWILHCSTTVDRHKNKFCALWFTRKIQCWSLYRNKSGDNWLWSSFRSTKFSLSKLAGLKYIGLAKPPVVAPQSSGHRARSPLLCIHKYQITSGRSEGGRKSSKRGAPNPCGRCIHSCLLSPRSRDTESTMRGTKRGQ